MRLGFASAPATIMAAALSVTAAGVTSPAMASTAAAVAVPCSATALAAALAGAASGQTLLLARSCRYVLTAALPAVSQDLTVEGDGATLERSYAPATPAHRAAQAGHCGLCHSRRGGAPAALRPERGRLAGTGSPRRTQLAVGRGAAGWKRVPPGRPFRGRPPGRVMVTAVAVSLDTALASARRMHLALDAAHKTLKCAAAPAKNPARAQAGQRAPVSQ
jgi:hypothetical protein